MAYTPVPEMSNLELIDKVKALEARIDALEKKKTRTKKAPESPTRDRLLASLGANDIVGNEPKYQATDDDLPKSFLTPDGPTNPYPTHHELAEFKAWANNLAQKLKQAGLDSAGKKLSEYILTETNQTLVTDIPLENWDSIKKFLDSKPIEELVSIVGRTL